MSQVRIAGIELTHFGQEPERTGRDLFAEAGLAALDDSEVPSEDIEESVTTDSRTDAGLRHR